MSKHNIILIIILVLGAGIRLFQLGDMPRGLSPSEITIGYDTWSLLHNRVLSTTDSIYSYVAAPTIALLGLSAFSVRLVSAICGIASIYGIYMLLKVICQDIKSNRTIALIGAFLYAISPFTIHLSRAAFETNLMLAVTIFGSYFVFRFLRNNKIYDAVSAFILFMLAIYTHPSALIIILIALSIAIINIKSPGSKKLWALVVLLIVAAIPKIISLHLTPLSFQTLELYASYFSPALLFFTGDKSDILTTTKEFGLVYAWEVVTITIGAATLFQKNKMAGIVVCIWILSAPIIPAITQQKLNTLDASLILPPLVILSAIGAKRSIDKLLLISNSKLLKNITLVIIILIPIYSALAYLHTYYQHYKYSTSWVWNEHTTLLAEYITQIDTTNNIVIEAPPKTIEYIKFFNATNNKQTELTRYTFIDEDKPVVAKNGDIVAIAGWKGTPSELKNIHEIKLLNGAIAFKVGVFEGR
jgi:hypothetical protein